MFTFTYSKTGGLHIMVPKAWTPLLFVWTLSLVSCDPGIGVAIANKTNTDKEVKVLYPPDFKFPGEVPYDLNIRDSVKTYDLTKANNDVHTIVIPMSSWDTVTRTYTFTLKANHSALVEHRNLSPLPTFGQVFIIDRRDTVILKRHGKDFFKRPKLLFGGTWTHTIKDKQ